MMIAYRMEGDTSYELASPDVITMLTDSLHNTGHICRQQGRGHIGTPGYIRFSTENLASDLYQMDTSLGDTGYCCCPLSCFLIYVYVTYHVQSVHFLGL